MMAPYVIVGTLEAEQMMHAQMTNTFIFPEGTLAAANEVDQAIVARIKGLSLNLATLL